MADVAKLQKIFEAVSKEYVVGKRSHGDFIKALEKLDAATRKANNGINLDFHSVEEYVTKREKQFQKYMVESPVDNMSRKGWQMIKKEAGIKKSGFLKKADAGVGKHIGVYAKAHRAWQDSAVRTAGGDHKLLAKAIVAGEKLHGALVAFVAAKEFKTDLAKEMQTMCQRFITDLGNELERMRECRKEAHDPTATLRRINELGLAQFKV